MKSSLIIPHFIRAGSAKALQALMFRTNLAESRQIEYYQIVYDGKSWFAWYYKMLDENSLLEQSTKIGNKDVLNKKGS